jgi:hypothetical protein
MGAETHSGKLVAAAIVGGLGVAALIAGLVGILDVMADSDWVEVQARVVDVKGEPYRYTAEGPGGRSNSGTGLRLKVTYAYDVAGQTHESARYSRDEPWDEYMKSSLDEGKHRLKSLQASGTVTAWYDPEQPSSAVLRRAERAPAIVVTAVGVMGLIAALALLVLRAMKRRQT